MFDLSIPHPVGVLPVDALHSPTPSPTSLQPDRDAYSLPRQQFAFQVPQLALDQDTGDNAPPPPAHPTLTNQNFDLALQQLSLGQETGANAPPPPPPQK